MRRSPTCEPAAATGMRRGELLGLRWRDIDFDCARLSVRQQFTRQGSGVGFGPPKSRKSIRTIDVDEETIALQRDQQERHLFDRRAHGPAYREDLDLVFCRPGGSPEDPNVIGRRFERRVRALRTVPMIALHGLRHTHATHARGGRRCQDGERAPRARQCADHPRALRSRDHQNAIQRSSTIRIAAHYRPYSNFSVDCRKLVGRVQAERQ